MTSVLIISFVYVGIWFALWVSDEINHRRKK